MPAISIYDRVVETTVTEGVSDFVLGGAVTNYRAFGDVASDEEQVYYGAIGASGWEVGIGTYDSDLNTLRRTTVLESSNANAKVAFAAGTKNVYCTVPSAFYQALHIGVTPTAGITETDVQAALEELDARITAMADDAIVMAIVFGE